MMMIAIIGPGLDQTFEESKQKIWKEKTLVGSSLAPEKRGLIVNGVMEKYLVQKHVSISALF